MQDRPRVSLREAALQLGVSEDTLRRKLKAGDLKGFQEKTPQGFRWSVELPASEPDKATSASAYADAYAPPRQAPRQPEEESPHLREVITKLEQTVARLERTQDRLFEELAARQREIQELHILLQRAQEGRVTLPPAPQPEQSGRAPAPTVAQATAGILGSIQQTWWWVRLTRSTRRPNTSVR